MFHGVLVNNVVIIKDEKEARELYKLGFYGKFVGIDKVKPTQVDQVNAPLQLSIIEALYLVENELLEVRDSNGNLINKHVLEEIGRRCFKNFDIIYRIYKDLRSKRLVVKSGLKFGSLFAVYEKGPGIDHAPMLVHFIEPNREVTALDITRAARLSHTVNKRFVLATWSSDTNQIDYVAFEWFTP